MERQIGEGVIEELAEKAIADRRLTTQKRRRIMSLPLTAADRGDEADAGRYLEPPVLAAL